MSNLENLLSLCIQRHDSLCPRQVLGVRMGLFAGKLLDLQLPQRDKSLVTIVECDGCGASGVEIATGCTIAHRTLRVLDYGKLAATFINTRTRQAVRIAPLPTCRDNAKKYKFSDASWENQLEAYQVMPDEELFSVERVSLATSLDKILSRPGLNVKCEICGEEISNEREVIVQGKVLCRFCAGDRYYISGTGTVPSPSYPMDSGSSASSALEKTHPIPVITFIGKSGSGKTTLLEKLIRELTNRGYRVAAVKHHSHRGFEVDVPGKDSWRFAQAGSKHVVISAPDKVAAYYEVDEGLSLDQITQGISNVDLILVEGYKQANKPSIEVFRSGVSKALLSNPEQCLAILSDIQLDTSLPIFEPNDIQGIRELIENLFLLNH